MPDGLNSADINKDYYYYVFYIYIHTVYVELSIANYTSDENFVKDILVFYEIRYPLSWHGRWSSWLLTRVPGFNSLRGQRF